MKTQPFLKIFLAVFFAVNLLSRWEIVFTGTALLSLVVSLAFVFLFFSIIVFPKRLKYPLWCFAFTFPLYGAPSVLYTSVHVFEFLLTAQSLALLVVAIRNNRSLASGGGIYLFLFLYVVYSFLSILVFPCNEYTALFLPWMFPETWIHMLCSNNWTPSYAFAALNRLALFVFAVVLIACQEDGQKILKGIFISVLAGGVIAALIGVLNQWEIVDCTFSVSEHRGRLQSVFAHPISFAMYLTVTVPFMLFVFFRVENRNSWKVLLCTAIFVSAFALIYAASRTSWIVYPVICAAGGVAVIYVHWRQGRQVLERKTVAVLVAICTLGIISGYAAIWFGGEQQENPVVSSTGKAGVKTSTLTKRLSELLKPTVRKRIVHDALLIVKEAPVFGLGFESYGWHRTILSNLPQSDYSQQRTEFSPWGTPHNFYLTQLVNGGIVGLLLWLTLTGAVCMVLLKDVRENMAVDSIPVLLCILAFHLYGLAESMQFTPILWFILLLCIGYGATVEKANGSLLLGHGWKRWTWICGMLVLAGGIAYGVNFQSWRLAEKYEMAGYYDPSNADQAYYTGFYGPSQKTTLGMMRWMGKKGIVQITHPGVMRLAVFYEYPEPFQEPVQVSFDVDGTELNELVFLQRGVKQWQYFFPKSAVGKGLNITVSRTWNPLKFGGQWARIQGIAVGAPQYFPEVPKDGIGFSVWEDMLGVLPDWAQAGQQYRWSDQHAFLPVDGVMQKRGLKMYLRARHPDIEQQPVVVQFFADGNLVETARLRSKQWQLVSIAKDKLRGSAVLTLDVSRTWNPRGAGISMDSRNLGVAVAIP